MNKKKASRKTNYKCRAPYETFNTLYADVIPDNMTMTRMSNSQLLHQEGVDLDHCVYQYEDDILNGYCDIYGVTIDNIRYTLEICRNHNDKYVVSQFYGHKNELPPTNHMDMMLSVVAKINNRRK